MRNSVVQVSSEGFVLTARVKGLRERDILFRHVLRNALLPVVTVLALTSASWYREPFWWR